VSLLYLVNMKQNDDDEDDDDERQSLSKKAFCRNALGPYFMQSTSGGP